MPVVGVWVAVLTLIAVPAFADDVYVSTEGSGAVYRVRVLGGAAVEKVGQFAGLNRPIATIEADATGKMWAFGGSEIGVLDLKTGETKAVACDGVMGFGGASAISADGKFLYAQATLNGANGEWGVVFDTETLTQRLKIDPASAATYCAAFSADSGGILYWWQGKVWRKPVAGGEAAATGDAPGSTVISMGPSQDGSVLVYTEAADGAGVDIFEVAADGCRLVARADKVPSSARPFRYNARQRFFFYQTKVRQIFCYDTTSKATAKWAAEFSEAAPAEFFTKRADGAVLLDGREFKEESAVFTDQTMVPGTAQALLVLSRGYRYPGYVAAWDAEKQAWGGAVRLEGGGLTKVVMGKRG